jgi:NAD(P)-dependent dehydrogenase (short-subunit alcohol dehydrogenase family)
MSAFASDALASRVAVVTGAGGGLGGAIVAQLAAMGAHVVALDLRQPVLDLPGEHMALACDITSESAVQAAAEQVQARWGRCDVLVNNAGILPRNTTLEETTDAMWDQVFAVNLKGLLYCARQFVRPMMAAGQGSIVNLSSIAATAPNRVGAYSASKGAVVSLTRQMAVEWGGKGIRTNAVSPGLVRTPMSEAFYADPQIHAARVAKVAAGRIGTPTELASVVAFLASDASAYVNGQEITVDGGFMLTGLYNLGKLD